MLNNPPASKIFLIRHSEKPTQGITGVLASGQENKKSLSVKGWQRAGALVGHFARLAQAGKATPQFLFASHSSSLRPQFTLAPLAEKLGLTINLDFGKGHEDKLADAVKASSGIVLIAWQHDFMAAVANAILGNSQTAPQNWPAERFDVTWVFDLDESTGLYRFSQIPQLLLAGDLATPIAKFSDSAK